ncbi:MAG: caspase family protein, partial [Actinomycetota bacterium]|nr:caspase family protein [Actinomycetota bacterium]
MAHILACLVGIDTYEGNVAQLKGCVNDIDAVGALLQRRARVTGDTLTITRLTNQDATRAGFISAFDNLFASCGPEDTALLYCSMHGSQEKAPPEFLQFEPDGYNETLVFHDSRTASGRDLADKELSVLVGELSARGTSVTVVLDCCHSGSGVRGLTEQAGVRSAPMDLRPRAVSDYLPGTTATRQHPASSDPSARYTLLAACQSDQTAKEFPVAGVHRGALSAALEHVLVAAGGPMSNLEVHRSVSAVVRGYVSDQTPQLECSVSTDVDRRFLDGSQTGQRSPLTVGHSGGRWQLDAGRVHGIPPIGPDGTGATFGLHALSAPPQAPALATVETTIVGAGTSQLRFEPPSAVAALDESQVYRAVVQTWPQPTATVSVGADVPSRDSVLARIESVAGIAVSDTDPDLLVQRVGDVVQLRRPDSTQAIVAEQAAGALDVERLIAEITQIGRWLSLWRLANPSSSYRPGDVTLEVVDPTLSDHSVIADVDGTVQASYRPDGTGGWEQPRIQLRVTNHSGKRLYLALLDLTELFGINVLRLEGNGLLDSADGIATGQTFAIADDGTHDLYLEVPDGYSRVTDLVKLLVSTTPIDAMDWRQANLWPPTRSRGALTADRDVSGRPAGRAPADDWTTREILLRTVRPVRTVSVSGPTTPLELAAGVVLHAPPGFTATVALSTHTDARRDAVVRLLPPVLADDPANTALTFMPTRSVGSEFDVLELGFTDTQRSTAPTVSPDNPLRLVVDQALAEEETILPIAFDGTDYLPIGFARAMAGQTEITIVRLPVTDLGLRSLGGSLKILFRKLVLRPLGASYDWPRLSLVTYETDPPTYESDSARVRAALSG